MTDEHLPLPVPPMTDERVVEILASAERAIMRQSSEAVKRGEPWPAGAILVGQTRSGDEALGALAILDLQQIHHTLKLAVRKEAARGFVVSYDGFIENTTTRIDAILVVVATPADVRGTAIPYRRSVEGVVVYDPITAPPEILLRYQQVFHDAPVVPGPSGRQ